MKGVVFQEARHVLPFHLLRERTPMVTNAETRPYMSWNHCTQQVPRFLQKTNNLEVSWVIGVPPVIRCNRIFPNKNHPCSSNVGRFGAVIPWWPENLFIVFPLQPAREKGSDQPWPRWGSVDSRSVADPSGTWKMSGRFWVNKNFRCPVVGLSRWCVEISGFHVKDDGFPSMDQDLLILNLTKTMAFLVFDFDPYSTRLTTTILTLAHHPY